MSNWLKDELLSENLCYQFWWPFKSNHSKAL